MSGSVLEKSKAEKVVWMKHGGHWNGTGIVLIRLLACDRQHSETAQLQRVWPSNVEPGLVPAWPQQGNRFYCS